MFICFSYKIWFCNTSDRVYRGHRGYRGYRGHRGYWGYGGYWGYNGIPLS